jgi:formimidoylglutamate deiminase
VKGVVLPGFLNAHSHAFQFAMAGMAEKHLPGSNDDFWSWREAMYECALSMQPDQIEAVAAMLYVEMLRKGYTHVAEFHYLHHDLNGRPYQNVAEIGERLLAAASSAGIKITLIPIFYQMGGFGKEAHSRQRRFLSKNVDDYLNLLLETRSAVNKSSNAQLGFGVHSLRAVGTNEIFKTIEYGPKDLPFHLHAAEQKREVQDCIHHLGQRPVQWLLNNLPVQDRFSIVHCTHLDDEEVKRLAKSGANVVLCPGTEGNLGDGIFRLTEFSQHYGNWTIGTDSHISLNPLEDLRWLDYAQRLLTHRRNTFNDGATVLMNKIIPSGRKALGIMCNNFFDIGCAFDAVVYSTHLPGTSQAYNEHLLPSLIYTADSSAIIGTLVNGRWIIKGHEHSHSQSIRERFSAAVRELEF